MMKKVHFETTKGEIVAELFDDDAPGTVDNFVGLVAGTKEWMDPKTREKVKRPFYDGLTFHRVIPNFVIQGGCPAGQRHRRPGLSHQVRDQGKKQVHQRGLAVDGPRRQGHRAAPSSSSATRRRPHLDKKHTVFGQVTSGLEVVDKIQPGDKMTRVWIEA